MRRGYPPIAIERKDGSRAVVHPRVDRTAGEFEPLPEMNSDEPRASWPKGKVPN